MNLIRTAAGSGGGRGALLALVALALGLFVTVGPDQAELARLAREGRAAAQADPAAAVALFAAVEVVVIALWLPVGIWMTLLAGFLFGVWWGTAVVSFAATAGAVLAMLSARYVFHDALRRAAQSRPRFRRVLARIDAGFRDRGAYYVLLLRLTPLFPFWLVNLGLGLTRVRLWDYWWASQLGMLPVTLVVANAGANLAEVDSVGDVLSVRVLVSLGLLPVVPVVLQRMAGRWLRPRPPAAIEAPPPAELIHGGPMT